MNEFLQRFTVGKRLFAGFGFLLVLMTVIAISAALSLSSLERHLDTIAVERTTKTRLSNTLYDAANLLYIDLQALLLSQNEAEREAVLTHIATNRENFARAYDELAAMPAREDGKRLVADIASARQNAAPLNDEVIRLAMAGEQEQALVQLHEKAIPGLQAWRDAVTANLERESRVMLQAQAEATAAAARARTVLFVVPVDPQQTHWPKITSEVGADGKFTSNPLHRMTPYLSEQQTARVLAHLDENARR